MGLTCAAPATVKRSNLTDSGFVNPATGRPEQAFGKATKFAPPARIPANKVVPAFTSRRCDVHAGGEAGRDLFSGFIS
jgi:hypothetical protein